MRIRLDGVSKRFRQEWVLRDVVCSFELPGRYAITGPNGAGKSTLLRLLSGHLTPSKGRIAFEDQGKELEAGLVYPKLSYAAPYIELIEEFTLAEAIAFHQRFKPFFPGLDTSALLQILGFQKAANKPVRHFSSGMKQRLRLALAICSDTPILLLDEPGTNLDQQGSTWYQELIHLYGANRLIIVASNITEDYAFCEKSLDILQWKTRKKSRPGLL